MIEPKPPMLNVEPSPNEAEIEKAMAITKLRETIANAQKIIEENRIQREALLKELAEIKGESAKVSTLPGGLEIKFKLISLKEELENTSRLKPGKRKELEKEIFNLEKTIKEKERMLALEKDREKNPFKYFLTDKLHPINFKVVFSVDRENASLEDINRVMGETGQDFSYGWAYKNISPESDYAVNFSPNGFYLELKNIDEVREKTGIKIDDPKAKYNLISPNGIVLASDIDYQAGQNLLQEKAEEYQAQQVNEYTTGSFEGVKNLIEEKLQELKESVERNINRNELSTAEYLKKEKELLNSNPVAYFTKKRDADHNTLNFVSSEKYAQENTPEKTEEEKARWTKSVKRFQRIIDTLEAGTNLNKKVEGTEEEKLLEELSVNRESTKQAREEMAQAMEALKAHGVVVSMAGEKEDFEGEEEVKEEIKKLPEKDKEKLGLGLSTIGYRVEKLKDDFFAKSLNLGIRLAKVNKKGTVGRFCTELRDSFIRDAEEAKKKGIAIQKGDNKSKLRQLGNIGTLTGNVLKYGRIVADITGASIANPLRYAMMGGMVTARAAEAGKEARLKNEEVIEKTRIQDADLAAEEAWMIYEKAGGARTLRGENEYEGGANASAEALKNAYLVEMPKDLERRLGNPTVALSFVQKVLRADIATSISRLNKKIEKIENDPKLLGKEIEKEKLLKRWEKDLKDYDRMITQYGTVDQLAMGARYTQTVGKGIVLGMQIETAIISVERMWEGLSHMLSHHEVPKVTIAQNEGKTLSHTAITPTVPTHEEATPPTSETPPLAHPAEPAPITPSAPDTSPAPEPTVPTENPAKIPLAEKPPTIPPDTSTVEPKHVEPTPPTPAPDVTEQQLKENLGIDYADKIVHKGEGIEHTFIRQIEHNPKLAQELGFKGDVNDKAALHAFAGREAHVIATQTGYVDNAGQEVRVMEADKVAYEIETKDGGIIVTEKTIDGKIIGTYDDKEGYEFGKNPDNQYEKVIDTTQQPIKIPATPPEEIYQSETLESESNPADSALLKDNTPTTESPHTQTPPASEPPLESTPALGSNTAEAVKIGSGEHFVGLSERENLILQTHPEFAKNPFHLTGEKLMQAYEVGQKNIAYFFQDNDEVWEKVKNFKAKDALKMKIVDGSEETPFLKYLHKLQDMTKLKPKGWILGHKETTNEYIARALQKVTKLGKLSQVKME